MKSLLIFSLASMTILASCGKSSDNNSTNQNLSDNSNDQAIEANTIDSTIVLDNPTFNADELRGLPRVVNLKSMMSSVKNQGARDTAAAFALVASVEAGIKKDLGYDINLSEEYLVYVANSSKAAPTIDKGLLLENDFVYQPTLNKKEKPDNKVLKRLIPSENVKLISFDKNINQMIKVLGLVNRPLIVSITSNLNSWSGLKGEVQTNDETEASCSLATAKKGLDCRSHSILITGYNLDKKVFMFKNSWGAKWGQQGYGTIPFRVVDKFADKNISYTSLAGGLVILSDFNKDLADVEVASFEVEVNDKKGSLEIEVDASLKKLNGRSIKLQSCLAGKDNEHVKCISKFYEYDGSDSLKIKSGFFRKPTLVFSASDLVDNREKDMQVVTGLYYVDDTGTHLLKQVMTALE